LGGIQMNEIKPKKVDSEKWRADWRHPLNATAATELEKPMIFSEIQKKGVLMGWGLIVLGCLIWFFAMHMDSLELHGDIWALISVVGLIVIVCGFFYLLRKRKVRKTMNILDISKDDCVAFERERAKARLVLGIYTLTQNYLTNGSKLLPLKRLAHISPWHIDWTESLGHELFSVLLEFDNGHELELKCRNKDEMNNLAIALELRCPEAKVTI